MNNMIGMTLKLYNFKITIHAFLLFVSKGASAYAAFDNLGLNVFEIYGF